MVYMESALSKLNKDDLIRIALNMQKSELRKNKNKLEADLKVSKSVTEAIKNHRTVLERNSVVMSSIPDVNVWKYLGYHLTLGLDTI